MHAHHETQVLLFIRDRKPILEQSDPRAYEQPFEFRSGVEKFFALRFGAEAHDALHSGTVVPAAVEQDDFSPGRKVRNVALEVPLRALALRGSRQRRDPTDPGIESLRDTLDHATLSSSVPSFEDHDHLELLVDDPVLQLHELAV